MIDLGKSKEVFSEEKKKFQNFLHKISVCGHQDLSNVICQTPCTVSGLKLHLGRKW